MGGMPKRKNTRRGKASAKENLTKLETAYGSQKELANRLGISPSTLRRYKKNDEILNPDIANKVGRMLGGFSKRIKTDEFQEKFEKRLGIEHKPWDKPGFVTMSTKEWAVQKYGYKNAHLIEAALKISPFVRFPRGQPDFVEFIDDPYNPHTGKPEGKRSIEILILRNPDYNTAWAKSLDRSEPYRTIMAVPNPREQNREWSFDETRDYLQENLWQPNFITAYTEKFRMVPSDVVGFIIRE